MAEPARKYESRDIDPDIKPDLRSLEGGGQTTPDRPARGLLSVVGDPVEDSEASLGEQEDKGTAGGWAQNFSGASKLGKGGSASLLLRLKKIAPSGIIGTVVVGGGIIAGFLGIPALAPIHLLANIYDAGDNGSTTARLIMDKLNYSKISKGVTSGVCRGVQIVCKFQRPSKYFLKTIAEGGIGAFDADGKLISPNKFLPNTRPSFFQRIDGAGGVIGEKIPAPEFRAAIAKDPLLAGTFYKAVSLRALNFGDETFQKVKLLRQFSGRNGLAGVDDEAAAKERVNTSSKGTKDRPNLSALADEGEEAVEHEIKTLLAKQAESENSKLAKAGKGNAVGLIAGAACLIGDVPGIITATARAYQIGQLVRYSAIFITTIEAMKAGDATPEQAAIIGGLLTATVNGKNAFDSFGVKNVLFGDTKPDNDSYRKFIPGDSVSSALRGVTTVTSSGFKKSSCKVLTNPVTGVAVDVATAPTIIGPLINIAVGVTIGIALEKLGPILINAVANSIPKEFYTTVLASLFGDITENLVGTDVGDGLVSGAFLTMAETDNFGGNVPLTPEQEVEYSSLTKQVQIARAEEDRAMLSPFDASSPNTFLGSIVNQLLPYASALSTPSGIVSSIVSLPAQSLGILAKSSTADAATGTKDPGLCRDPNLEKVATGAFCNLLLGIPKEFLTDTSTEMDLDSIAKELVKSGDIDSKTGAPINKSENQFVFDDAIDSIDNFSDDIPGAQSLYGWQQLCLSDDTMLASSCVITDKKTAKFALYTAGLRWQRNVDGEDKLVNPSGAEESASWWSSGSSANIAASATGSGI